MTNMAHVVATDRTATQSEVLAAREDLLELGNELGLTGLRVLADGTVVAHVDEPSYRAVKRYATEASRRVGVWVNVIRDDVPAAEAPAEAL